MTLALGVALTSIACRNPRDAGEPRAIARAFEEFESAAPSDRGVALNALKDARCTDPANCADRDECARYAATVMRANELVGKARTLGPEDAGGNGAATPEERAVIVSAAEDALREAERVEPVCLAALRRLHLRAAGGP